MSPTAVSNVQLPDWKKGKDRQRGRRLFQYPQKTDHEPNVLRRIKGQLQPMYRLSDVLNPDLIATHFKHRAIRDHKPSTREVDATLDTALRLAANGEFVAKHGGEPMNMTQPEFAHLVQGESKGAARLIKAAQSAVAKHCR